MRSDQRNLALFLGLLLTGCVTCRAFGAEVAIPGEIEAALRGAAGSLEPITLTWSRMRQTSRPIEEVCSIVHISPAFAEQSGFFSSERVKYLWKEGKAYCFVNNSGRNRRDGNGERWDPMMEWEQEISFDGTKYYNGDGTEGAVARHESPNLRIWTMGKFAVRKDAQKTLMFPRYFHEAGFKLPQSIAEFSVSGGPRAKSSLLWLVECGARISSVAETTLDGRKVGRIELDGSTRLAAALNYKDDVMNREQCKYVFYLDPSLNFAVRRREELSKSGKSGVICECRDFVRLAEGSTWIPQACRVDYYTHAVLKDADRFFDTPLYTDVFTVLEVSKAAIPDERFVLNYDHVPGSLVMDDSLPGAGHLDRGVLYRVPASPDQLEPAITTAIDNQSVRGQIAAAADSGRWLIVASGITVVLLGLGWWWRRSRHQSR